MKLSFAKNKFTSRRDYADCSGCSLCLLVCPVWRQTRDFSLTPHGRAKVMQQGEAVSVTAVESCTVCMACNPVCPEGIDLVAMILQLRSQQTPPYDYHKLQNSLTVQITTPIASPAFLTTLLPDAALRAHATTLSRVANLLGGENFLLSDQDGTDISLALELGAEIPELKLETFLTPLRLQKKIIAADGLLLWKLKQWLPYANIISLGEAISSHVDVRSKLRHTDFYVIETRAYHADYERMVRHYHKLHIETGCTFNLDLQRIAIPATARSLPQRLELVAHDDDAQVRWMLHGRNISRIVVESLSDRAAIERVTDVPVVHLADLAEES